MDTSQPYPLIVPLALLLIVGAFLILAYWSETDQDVEFDLVLILGLACLIMGLTMGSPLLGGVGAVFFVLGLAGRAGSFRHF